VIFSKPYSLLWIRSTTCSISSWSRKHRLHLRVLRLHLRVERILQVCYIKNNNFKLKATVFLTKALHTVCKSRSAHYRYSITIAEKDCVTLAIVW